jgi:cytochrome c-type biogenesis protein CcmE
MKKQYLVLLFFALLIFGVLFVSLGNSDAYASFSEAKQNSKRTFHVAGTLASQMPMEYNPFENANLFKFYMNDRSGELQEVWLNGPKPQDFDRSEEVVVIGQWAEGRFMAHKVLTKCPSKYNETETVK